MSTEHLLNLLTLLSAIESWSFSTGHRFPDYLLERLLDCAEVLRDEILKGEKK